MTGRTLRLSALALLCFCGVQVTAQTRVEFHLLPAISTGPLDPDWSPDGELLAVAMRGDIWRIPSGGGEAVALTSGPAYYSEPAFSPDGKKIAVTVDIDGNLDIGVVDATGGAVELLTDHPEIDFSPVWSGDGNSLYFVSRRAGNLDILKMQLDDGALVSIVAGPRNDFQPALSPDGRYLAYVSPVEDRNGSGGIWVMSLPGGEPRLAHFEESSYRMKPEWSPDGANLVYTSDASGSNDVAVVPVAGGNRIRLTQDAAGEFDAALSPDGATVAFVSNHDGPTTLYAVSSAGGARSAWSRVGITGRKPRFETGVIRGRVLDREGRAMPARLMLTASDGRSYTEDAGFHRMVPATRTHYQHTGGRFEIEVPAGTTQIEAMHGFEFMPAGRVVDVQSDSIVEVELRLQPFDDPRSRGWYSGDMHVHDLHEGRFGLSHEAFYQQLAADDLGVANALIHMDGTKIMGRWSDLTGSPSQFSDQRTILRYSQEFRGYFGHVGLVGVKRFVMPLIGGVSNTPFAPDTLAIGHIDAARAQGAIAGFVHPYNQVVATPSDAGSRDIPVVAALGKGDFYDVASVASKEADSAAVYYKLLNSGIRLAATGGTDNFSDVWYDASGGAARTYARIAPTDGFGFDSWLAAVRDGRTFATTGPLLFLTVNGSEPGEEIRLQGEQAGSLDVRVRLGSIAPVDRVDILLNGEVVASRAPSGEGPMWDFEFTTDAPGGGWIAARATGPSSRYIGDGAAFAQTSPVYVRHDGKAFTSAADAKFLLQSVETLWQLAQARDSWVQEAEKTAYRQDVYRARDFYRRVILEHPEDAVFTAEAPEVFRVRIETTKGPVVVELHRNWSPQGVDRFYNLVRHGYYDNSRFFRIRDGDFVQFGINGMPAIARAWRDQRIGDDPVVQSNLRGTVAFAMGYEPNDRTTQIYINLTDKPQLDELGFAVIGRVVDGMTIADTLYSGYGESAGGGIRGGRQDPVFQGGNAYLDENFPELDALLEATVVESGEASFRNGGVK